MYQETCLGMFMAVLLVIKLEKPEKTHMSIKSRTGKLWYTKPMEYSSAVKMNQLHYIQHIDGSQEHSVSVLENKQVSNFSIYKQFRNKYKQGIVMDTSKLKLLGKGRMINSE